MCAAAYNWSNELHNDMFRRGNLAILVGMVAGTLFPLSARPDMYVWTDNAGVMHVSNVPPPEAVRMVSVTRAVPKNPTQEAAFRDAAREAEVRALNERVQQLQAEVEQVRREPPPPVLQAQTPAPPYVIVVSPPPAPVYEQPVAGCDYRWGNCGFGFLWPGFLPASVVVVGDRHFRHPHPIHHGHARLAGRMNVPSSPPARKPGHWRK
jgi:Domain of unknown function (DUF4124)